MLRQIVWWDGEAMEPPPPKDYMLPEVGVAKLVGKSNGKSVILAVTVGHTDGHHSHVDVGSFVYHIDGESLIPDAGRGKYSKNYFRQERYDNIFNNAYTHNIPRIGGSLQQPGPEFGGCKQFHGSIIDYGEDGECKFITLDFHTAYDIPNLTLARRHLQLNPVTGEAIIHDSFEFDGDPLPIEESFVTWHDVTLNTEGDVLLIKGEGSSIGVRADGAIFEVETLEQASRDNERAGVLKRISTITHDTQFTLVVLPIKD
jgi:hypothetical protein